MGGYRHPDLAHVAHHEAVLCVEVDLRSRRSRDRLQVSSPAAPTPTRRSPAWVTPNASAREEGKQIKVGKFPFQASGRALAAGEPDGFVKLIFDAKYGELLGVHMIGETVTELLAELVLARKLEATEAEIIEVDAPAPDDERSGDGSRRRRRRKSDPHLARNTPAPALPCTTLKAGSGSTALISTTAKTPANPPPAAPLAHPNNPSGISD